jgi:transposase
MLTVETIGRIRREHFIKGKTIREISRDLKVSRNTVRKVLRSGETAFEYERDVQPRPKLGRWTEELDVLLAGNAAKPAREQLTLIRIFEELHGRGYDGGYDAVRRYARRWAAAPARVLYLRRSRNHFTCSCCRSARLASPPPSTRSRANSPSAGRGLCITPGHRCAMFSC